MPAPRGSPGLLSDSQLSAWAERLSKAEQAALTQAQTSQPTPADEIVRRLQEQGARPEVISQAQRTAAADQQHADHAVTTARDQMDRLNRLGQRAAAEVERREQLPPHRREQETEVRQQMQALTQPRPPAPPVPAPRIAQPNGEAQSRRHSL